MPVLNNFDSRWLRRIFLGLTIVGTQLEGQSPRRSPTEIAQIVDAALQAVIPPERMLSQVTVAERGVRFDSYKRWLRLVTGSTNLLRAQPSNCGQLSLQAHGCWSVTAVRGETSHVSFWERRPMCPSRPFRPPTRTLESGCT